MAGLISSITDAVGLTDSGAAEDAMKKASGVTKEQMKRLDAIDLPDIEKMKILLENPELVGLLEAEQLEGSALEEISLDPKLRENQMKALQSLATQAEEGLTSQDKYAMEQLLGDVAAQERSQLAGIDQEMARRGMESSGAAERAKREALQSGANEARQRAMQMAAQGQQNRMQALQALGQQSGQMQSQDYAQQAQIASARDAIAQANAANRQNVSAQNLAARQNIENQRANLANQQQMYNKGLIQQQFQNELQKAGAQNTVSGNLANMYQNQAAAQAQADASTMSTLGGLGAAFIAAPAASDVRVKTEIEEGENGVREMLDKLQPYEYNYKDEVKEDLGDEGRQLGVMAQDLEASSLGSEFVQEDENGVKRVDYGKMGSTQMAAISDLHQRIKALESLLGNKE